MRAARDQKRRLREIIEPAEMLQAWRSAVLRTKNNIQRELLRSTASLKEAKPAGKKYKVR